MLPRSFRPYEGEAMRFGPVEHLFRTLRFQLTFWNTIAILVLVSAALWGVREGLRWILLTELDKLLAEDVEEVRLTIERYYPHAEQLHEELNIKALSHSDRGWYVRIFSKDDKQNWNQIWASDHAPELSMPMVNSVKHGAYNRGSFRLLQSPISLSRGD